MKQFGTVFNFELKGHIKNKSYIAITVILVVLTGIILSFPRIEGIFSDGKESEKPDDGDKHVMIIGGDSVISSAAKVAFEECFKDYEITLTDKEEAQIRDEIRNGNAECAFILSDDGSYSYYVNTLELYDDNTSKADLLLKAVYQAQAMLEGGLTEEQTAQILSIDVTHNIEVIGADQTNSFFYTYIMIFVLYMVILLYGQMISTSVANEKSSRAMELLITSVKPTSMLFGKVLAACVAGIIQLVSVFGSALLFFRLNRGYWDKGGIIASIFDIPGDIFAYMIVFFILGFALYAFMYGAVGSTVSKLEELNSACMPISIIFVVGFIIVITGISGAGTDNLVMKICSFVPFTSPMSMFARIAMDVVPPYEIVISIAILIASTVGIGVLSARIYRSGVLMYGSAMKFGQIIKLGKKKQ